MQAPVPPNTQHCIYFQAFLTSPELSDFLLSNRLQWVRAMLPTLAEVRVVIQGTTTVKPHHVTLLACLLEEYHRAGVIIRFENASPIVYPYLRSIGFFALWDAPKSLEIDSFLLPNDSTSFVLWRAIPESMDAYVNAAYQHYHSGFFAGKDLSFLTTYLSELLNNVFDHAFAVGASSRIAFAFLQYYPSRRRLFISVSDFGMGIPTSVNKFLRSEGKEPVMASEALRLALRLHFTAKSHPHNRGRGLDTLSKGVERLSGQLTIQTSRVIYHISRTGRAFSNKMSETAFPGTTASITVFYNALQAEETDLLEDDAALF